MEYVKRFIEDMFLLFFSFTMGYIFCAYDIHKNSKDNECKIEIQQGETK